MEINNLALLRKVIDSMKHLSPEIEVSIQPSGSLHLNVTEIEYKTQIQIGGLSVTVLDPANWVDTVEAKCTISTKRLGQILTNNTFKRCTGYISIKDEYLFRLELFVRDDLVLHYALPALYRDT